MTITVDSGLLGDTATEPLRAADLDRAVELLVGAEAQRAEAIGLLGGFQSSGWAECLGYTSLTRLLTHQVGLTNRAAHTLVRSAEWVDAHPTSGKALAMGHITPTQLEALATAARGMGELFDDFESQLLDAAQRPDLDADRYAVLCRAVRSRVDTDAAVADAEHTHTTRGLWLQYQLDGGATGTLRLDPISTETLLQALQTRPDPADSLTEPRTLAQRRHDHLIDICHESLTTIPGTCPCPTCSPDPQPPAGAANDPARSDTGSSTADAPTAAGAPTANEPAAPPPSATAADAPTAADPSDTADQAPASGTPAEDSRRAEPPPSADEPSAGAPPDAAPRAVQPCRARHGTAGSRTIADVVIDIETLAGEDLTNINRLRSELASGAPIAGPGLDRLLCDASFRALVVDGPRTVLAYNRATPDIPPALRRAIQLRDRHCQFTGCDRPWQWCDLHHVIPRHRRGPTNHDNLILLCRFHHTTVHEGGWQLTRAPNGTTTITSP